MMRKKSAWLIGAALALSLLFTGCQAGVPQEQYDQLEAQLAEAKAQATNLQDTSQALQAQADDCAARLQAAEADSAGYQQELDSIREQYVLEGATPAQTAENIVQQYAATHVYSKTDMFICGDMSSEVWNMLKAQGISSIIVVGSKDAVITDILLSNHAWVLAEVSPGEYLALETTNGTAIPKSQNPLYYRGWYFNSPADLKNNNQLVREYNIRVSIHNEIVGEDREVINEYNNSGSQQTAEKLAAVHEKLVDIIESQEAELNGIKAEIDGLAAEL